MPIRTPFAVDPPPPLIAGGCAVVYEPIRCDDGTEPAEPVGMEEGWVRNCGEDDSPRAGGDWSDPAPSAAGDPSGSATVRIGLGLAIGCIPLALNPCERHRHRHRHRHRPNMISHSSEQRASANGWILQRNQDRTEVALTASNAGLA